MGNITDAELHVALDALELQILSSMRAVDMARLLVGYFTAVEMFTDDTGDGNGKVPQPVLDYHNAVKAKFGV